MPSRSSCEDSPRRASKASKTQLCCSSTQVTGRPRGICACGDSPRRSSKSPKTYSTTHIPRRPSKNGKPQEPFCLRTRVEYPLQGLWLVTEIFGNALHGVFGALLFYIGTSCARNIKYIEHLLVTVTSLATDDERTKTTVLQFAWAFTYIFVFYGLFLINAFVMFATRLITSRPSESEE